MSSERELLLRLAAGPATGDALAQGTGLTRAAVWKRIEALRGAGVRIEAQPGRGYSLAAPLEVLEPDDILQALPTGIRPRIAALEVAWSLDSTNSELLRRQTPAGGATVLLAEQQTGGRGRRGRAWASPVAANLYLSIARHFSGGLARLGGLSLVAGIAVAEALRTQGLADVGLKWPNDLVVGGRKLGGLLVEGGGEHGGPVRAVIGVGINVRMPQAFAMAIDQPWIDLAAMTVTPPSRNAIAAQVLTQLLPVLDQFDEQGLAPFLSRYASLDALMGREVLIHSGGGTEQGLAEGIADDGALRVRMAGEVRNVHAGEVSVRTQ
jgi:BirA family transcriptional regulator, biotin operon repressor / biotin---[acetyl-CoA-carboxylase] ligase